SWGYPFLFENAESRKVAVEMWRRIAERYAGEPTVIGYDLLNEPIAPFTDTTRLNPLLEPFYKEVVAAIRTVDTNHVVFLGGAQWNNNFRVFGAPFERKLVYTFHKYWCDTTQAMIQEYVDFRAKYNVPLWMGESGENTDAWISAWRNLQERNNIGWCFWPYKKLDSPRCLVTFDQPRNWDLIVRFADGPRVTFQDIRTARPPIDSVRQAFDEFLSLCRFSECRLNSGYAEALGINSKKEP
ncbi:MAG: glycoside hydrolase family 5 protein, partial [Ignavibacteriae bacterium]